MRWLPVVLGCIVVAEAIVEFDKSILYDEIDFYGKESINLPSYCSPGCRVYASVPIDSTEVARKIFVDDLVAKTSLADIALLGGEGNSKGYYQVAAGNFGITLSNENEDQSSAPIMLWIVRGDAPNLKDVIVFDSDDRMYGAETIPGRIITFMGAVPFLVRTTTYDEGITYRTIIAGFDAVNSKDVCVDVLTVSDLDDKLTYVPVKSPLITYIFDSVTYPEAKVQLFATITTDPVFDMDRPMFATSPGYFSCEPKESTISDFRTKTFSSTAYPTHSQFVIAGNGEHWVEISADLNLDEAHAVSITNQNDGPESGTQKWFGEKAAGTNIQDAKFLTAKTIISWDRNEDDLDRSFLLRVVPIKEPKTTTVEPEVKTTTAEPEPEVKTTTTEPEPEVKTTTSEPEPDVKTTASEPEPEVKTTTSEPEPEVKTTTSEPEPEVKTTTSEPEPEVKTTTSEPEPEVKTTTSEPEPEVKTTTSEPEVKTTSSEPEPPKTTLHTTEAPKTTRPTTEAPKTTPKITDPPQTTATRRGTSPIGTRRTPPATSSTTFHPKSTVIIQTSTTVIPSPSPKTAATVVPTTSGVSIASTLLSLVLAAVLMF